jgi:hypothetical protein
MTNANGNGAMPHTRAAQPSFDPAAGMALWMSSTARLMRAGGIFMRGMTEVTRLEAELGQQYMQRGMAAMQSAASGAKPGQLGRTQIDQAMQDVDGLITTMRKITDQVRHMLGESTQALLDVADQAAELSPAAAVHDDPSAARKRTQAEAALSSPV